MTRFVQKGTSTAFVQVKGIPEVHEMLAAWLEPELTNRVDVATKAEAKLLAGKLRTELRPISKHMARAVRVKRARTGKPGWVVGSKRKIAFFWHMVIGGTRAHGPRRADNLVFVPNWNPYIGASSRGIATGRTVRTKHVRGVPPNPAVARVVDRYGSQAVDEFNKALPPE